MDWFDFREITAEWIAQATDASLAEADALVASAIAAAMRPGATFADVIGRFDRALGDVWARNGETGFMVRVHPDEAVRTAAQASEERAVSWRRGLMLRDDVAAAATSFMASADAATRTGQERRVIDRWARDLRRAGHGLPDDERAEIRTIVQQVVSLEATFERNVDEWSDGIDVTRDDLVGLSEDYIEGLRSGTASGTWRVTLENPDYLPFIEGSPRRHLREALLRKRMSRAVDANRPILEEILGLRRRHAAILGFPSWAHYRIEPKMAGTPGAVEAFQGPLFEAFGVLADVEYAAMSALLGADSYEGDLQPWDVPYYDQRIRRLEHGVDAIEVSAYLTLDAVIDGLLALSGDVFGLRFVEIAEPKAWHPTVRAFDVFDAASATHLGGFYADLHPRPGKFGHAMAMPLRLARSAPDGTRAGGVSAIVANVPAATAAGPARLRHDDVVMLFHEFGHVLHEVLGTNGYYETSMLALEEDFPEAVSQIMENWAWHPDVLTRVTRHADTGESMPRALAERVAASRNVNLGTAYLRDFALVGDFDLRIHGPEPVDLDDTARASARLIGVPWVEGTFWPAAVSHLVGGYDAGYYGYLWSLVYGYDLWSRFAEGGITDPGVGADYRRQILEPGASQDAAVLVEAFLGRPFSNASFLRETGLRTRVVASVPADA